jgi:hypothetical protein
MLFQQSISFPIVPEFNALYQASRQERLRQGPSSGSCKSRTSALEKSTMAEAGTKLPCRKETIVEECHMRPLHFMLLGLTQVP